MLDTQTMVNMSTEAEEDLSAPTEEEEDALASIENGNKAIWERADRTAIRELQAEVELSLRIEEFLYTRRMEGKGKREYQS